ncbi:DNA polymerase I [Patescibacteria group bacterium]|nr:DNA polymerase I [Patescibacteria group bacterium]
MKEKFLIIDSNALIHRAFHALPDTMQNSEGLQTNSIYGFTNILIKIIEKLKPTHVVACFDIKKKTFRNDLYKEYKANRKKQPQELYDQIPYIKKILSAFNIKILEEEGYEADDLIGSVVYKIKNIDKIILTGDKDSFQLIDNETSVLTFKKGISETFTYDISNIKNETELNPEQIINYKALRGDASDNIPGISGIGEITSIKLLKEFNNLENLYKNIENNYEDLKKEKLFSERILQKIKDEKEKAFLSKKLATIKCDLKINYKKEDFKLIERNNKELKKLFEYLNFFSLVKKLNLEKEKYENKQKEENIIFDKDINIKNIKDEFIFLLDENLKGIIYYFENNIHYSDNVKKYKKIFEDKNIKKISYNLKDIIKKLKNINIEINNIYFDIKISNYILFSGENINTLEDIIEKNFNYKTKRKQKNENKTQTLFDDIKEEMEFKKEEIYFIKEIYELHRTELIKRNQIKLFENIEMKLIEVLSNMELNGILIDKNFLEKIQKEYTIKIDKLKKETFNISGYELNLNSPKQIQELLFEKLKINKKGIKKIKTGYSTSTDDLKKILINNPKNKELIELLINFREADKLKNTYIDNLPNLIKNDGKIHCNFNQSITATGRLSSSDPNMQNIPKRTEDGNNIRKIFIAEKNKVLVSIDYSQIELRIAANLAKEEKMIDSFNKNLDIHTATAAFLNNKNIEDVTKTERRDAKSINFGVLYGMGPRKFSRETGKTQEEGKKYIEKYFEVNNNIKKYIEDTKKFAHKNKFVENIFKRRRYLKNINSKNPMISSRDERMAVNMPIQGTAADIIKIAMIDIYEYIKEKEDIKMLLQIHDELLFEIEKNKIEKYIPILINKMEQAHKFENVQLKVEVKIGEDLCNMNKY